MNEVRRLGTLKGADVNDAKVILADEATRLCHGIEAAEKAKETARTTFSDNGMGDGLRQVSITTDSAAALSVIAALTMVGFAKSNGDARRLIRGGGARVNGRSISDENTIINHEDFNIGKVKISAGKKRHALIIID